MVLILGLAGCTSKAMEEPEYLAWVDDKTDEFEALEDDIRTATEGWQGDSMSDAEAVGMLQDARVRVQALLKEMEGIEPPDSVAEGHGSGITSMKLFVMVLDETVRCIETNEEHHCAAAATHHQNAVDHFEAWTDAIDRIR